MSDEQKNSNFIIGFLIGSSISMIATLILYPRSGEKNRQVLRKTSQALPQMADDFATTLQMHTNNWLFLSQKKWHKTLRRFQLAVKAGVEASRNQANLEQ